MSDFGTNGAQKALDSAAVFEVNKFMAKDTAEKLQALRETLLLDEVAK